MNEDINTFLESIEYKSIIVNICVGVSLMTIFLPVFYFYYVLEVEHNIVSDNINIMTVNLIESIKPFLTPYTKNNIQQKLKKVNMKKEDDAVRMFNKELQNTVIYNVGIISVICMVLGYVLSQYFNINFLKVLRNNIYILLLLGITEWAFLHILPSKIITGDPNYIKYKVLVNIKEKLKM